VELAPTPLSGSVPMRTAAALLVSGASAAYRLQSAEPRAIRRAEHLAPVTAGTHLHADPATPTVVHPNDRLAHARTSPQRWTAPAEAGIKIVRKPSPKRCRDGEGPG
jgi:hypothetical protein